MASTRQAASPRGASVAASALAAAATSFAADTSSRAARSAACSEISCCCAPASSAAFCASSSLVSLSSSSNSTSMSVGSHAPHAGRVAVGSAVGHTGAGHAAATTVGAMTQPPQLAPCTQPRAAHAADAGCGRRIRSVLFTACVAIGSIASTYDVNVPSRVQSPCSMPRRVP
eukprot:1447689-Prymnesium_polylepis.1